MRTLHVHFAWFVLALASTGCLVERPPVPQPECTLSSDCPSGKVCAGVGRCTDACAVDRDCPAPYACAGGACVAPEGRCARDGDCAEGQACAGTYCAVRCTDASGCASGQSCVNGACLAVAAPVGCRFTSECAAGEACVQGRCGPRCAADADCNAPLTCAQGACVAPTGRCVADGDCQADEACVSTVCARRCASTASCSVNQACLNGACANLDPGPCRYNSECANGQACVQGRCAPACLGAADCAGGTECRGGSCQPPAASCFASAQCDAGFSCAPQGSCVPTCSGPSDCAGAGQVCSNGACVTSGPTTATIVGQVIVTGVADAGVFAVSVKGPNRLTGATRSDGTFEFAGLLPGLYDVSVTVPATEQGTVTREVTALAGTPATVSGLTFSPVGSARGRVTLQGQTSFEGIGLSALGTARGTVTSLSGDFTLTGLPPGTYELLATAPGYQAGRFQAVSIAWQGTTSLAPDLQLVPVPAGSTFAFSSLPPASVRLGQPFTYTALAGGGGVSAVTYVLESGPRGMSLDPGTGQVRWTPSEVGRPFVVISARGGSQVVYQYFELEVVPIYPVLGVVPRPEVELVDAGFWMVNEPATGVVLLDRDGGTREVLLPTSPSGAVTSVSLLTGGAISGVSGDFGTAATITMPVGTASVSWQGGAVSALSSPNAYQVTGRVLAGGTVAGVSFPGANRVRSVSYATGTPASVTVQTHAITGVRARTGLVATVTADTLTDGAASWATGELTSSLCVSDAAATFKAPVSSHTATSITVNTTSTGPLNTRLAVGQRYFVITCSSTTNNLQYVFEASASTFGSLTGTSHQVALYTRSLHLGNFSIAANTATTVTFLAPLSRWLEFSALASATTRGFFGVGPASGTLAGVEARLVDPMANFAAGLSSASRLAFEGLSSTWPITGNTQTEVVFRFGFNELLTALGGRKWLLTNTSGQVPVTLTTTDGNLPANAGASARLWIDGVGASYQVTSNTATDLVINAQLGEVPFAAWANSELAWAVTGAALPSTEVIDADGLLVPNAHQGRALFRVVGPGNLVRERTITSHTSSRVLLTTGGSCSSLPGASCVRAMEQLRSVFTGARWAPGTPSGTEAVDYVLALGGSPGLSPGALVGAPVLLPGGQSSSVLANGAESLTVTISESNSTAFENRVLPFQVSVASPFTGNPLVLNLTSTGAGWSTNQWAGFRVVAPNGAVAGRVFSNTADTLELETMANTSSELDALSQLTTGARFALAGTWPEGLTCPGGFSIRARVDLSGATLTPGTGVLRFRTAPNTPLTAYSVDVNGGDLAACPSSLPTLIGGEGQPALLSRNDTGSFSFTVQDSSFTPNSLGGMSLEVLGPDDARLSASSPSLTISNTAQSVSLEGLPPSSFIDVVFPYLRVGNLFWFQNADSLTRVRLVTDLQLSPSALKNRWLRLTRAGLASSSVVSARVVDHDASTFSLLVPASVVSLLSAQAGANRLQHVVVGQRQYARIGITPPQQPGALVGETVILGQDDADVLSNTANELLVATYAPNFVTRVRQVTSWQLQPRELISSAETLSRTSDERLLALMENRDGIQGLMEVSPGGTVTIHNALRDGRSWTAAPVPGLTGLVAVAPTSFGGLTTYVDPSWSFVPDSLVGQTFLAPECASSATIQRLIVANTATSLTIRGTPSCLSSHAGKPWATQTWRLSLAGTPLQPGALAGRTVRVGGGQYRVRSNTATELQLVPPDSAGSQFDGTAGEPLPPGGAPIFVAEGFPDSRPVALAALPTGWAIASSDEVVRYEGGVGRHFTADDSATAGATVTIAETLPNDVYRVTPATLTPGALVNLSLDVGARTYQVVANTADRITLESTTSGDLKVPVKGGTYRLTAPDGFVYVDTLQVDGAVVWAGSSSGLYRHDGSGWTRFSVASTESAPGAADGLISNEVSFLSVTAPGELWASSLSEDGIARFTGGTWSQLTRASTESQPGAADGLPEARVSSVTRDASGGLWFAHANGVSRLSGTSWQQNFGLSTSPGSVERVIPAPWGQTYVLRWSGQDYELVTVAP